jgi:hypothetical protein
MSALQPLSEEEQKQGPYDIRSWGSDSATREKRIAVLHELLQEGSVRMVASAVTEPPMNVTCNTDAHLAWILSPSCTSVQSKSPFPTLSLMAIAYVLNVYTVHLLQIINDEAIKGIYCPAGWVTEGHQGTGKGDGAQQVADSDLNGKPRSLWKVGGKHPFISVNGGRKAKEVLSALVSKLG